MDKTERDKVLEKEMRITEEFFGTLDDPDQIPINKESVEKLDSLSSSWIETEFDDNYEPIAWAVAVPTQSTLARRFLNKEITERQLLDLTKPEGEYDALYFVSAITVPEHRRKGLAIKTLRKVYENAPITKKALLFAWPITEEGFRLIKKVEKELGIKFRLRN